MKRKFQQLVERFNQNGQFGLQGDFSMIRGGLPPSTNPGACQNTGTMCSGTNGGNCKNTGDCSKATNKGTCTV